MENTLEYYMNINYRMEFEKSLEAGGYYASYPALPGCNGFGRSMAEAAANALKNREKWTKAALLAGLEIPESDCQSGFEVNAAGKLFPRGAELIYDKEFCVVGVEAPKLYGAILGDMIGSPYEFDRGDKTKYFELFDRRKWVHYTDDTVMTLAIAKALVAEGPDVPEHTMKAAFIERMQSLGKCYAEGEYGARFAGWLREENPQPYGSYGNGSAMRVSAIGWCYDTVERTREVARWSAEVSHNHPEGIKGAESVAAGIFLLRNGASKEEVKEYIEREFGYDLSRSCDEIRPYYHHVESCQETVPEAITAFMESTDFEDAIRTAVSLGGDSDTLTAITGSLAEAYYGVPKALMKECEERLPEELLKILRDFQHIGED